MVDFEKTIIRIGKQNLSGNIIKDELIEDSS